MYFPNAHCTKLVEIFEGGETTGKTSNIPVRKRYRKAIPKPDNVHIGTSILSLDTEIFAHSLKVRLLKKHKDDLKGKETNIVGLKYLLCYGK